jgi:hypothetical protein
MATPDFPWRGPRSGGRFPLPEWVALLADAQRQGRLDDGRLHPVRSPGRQPDAHARVAPLRARQPDRHSNKPFSARGEIFGDEITAAAMIDGSSTTPKSSR